MQYGRAVISCTLSVLLASCAGHSEYRAQNRANVEGAKSVASKWLNLLDAGDYQEAFEWEAQDFRMTRTQQQFVRFMQARRAPFGQAHGRQLIGAANVHKLVGVPEGNYVSVLFKTEFEKKKETAERVILVQQPVGWRVLDYRIY